MSAVAELFPSPASVSIEAIDKADANRLFVAWEHPLGACERPFGQDFHVRFDGWTKVRTVKKSSPGKGSTWAKPSATDSIGDGIKTLWIYRYEAAHSGSKGPPP